MSVWGVVKNKFADVFKKYQDKEEIKRDETIFKNSQAISQEQLDSVVASNYMGVYNDCDVTHVDFQPIVANKMLRVSKYREMYLYPEITDAIDQICNDAIVHDDFGDVVKLNIALNDNSKIPSNIEKRIRAASDYIVKDIFQFEENGYDLFKKYLIEGELYLEIILDDAKKNIIGIKTLPSFTMIPLYKEGTGDVQGYIQVTQEYLSRANVCQTKSIEELRKENAIARYFEENQIIYVNYGVYGFSKMDVRGYLEPVIRPYNQLKSLEDAIVVYRLVRAPERKVWNVYTGKMPKGKAEEYIQGLQRRYRKRNIYNPDTGAIDSNLNVQAATEDIWFSKDENGAGTTVDTIGGAMNLGQIDDINYFLKKLYKALKYPSSRWQEPSGQYTGGRMGEVTRDEIKFAIFIESCLNRFKYVLINPLRLQLRLNGIDKQYLKRGVLNYQFTKSSYFKEFAAFDILEQRFGMLGTASSYIWSPENPNGYFDQEFVLKKYFKMPEDEYNENTKLLEKRKKQHEEDQMNNPDQFGGDQFNQQNQFNDQNDFNQDQNNDQYTVPEDTNEENPNAEDKFAWNSNDIEVQ